MKKIIINLISGELFFVLFLYGGVFKGSLGFTVDISAIFLLLTFMSVLFKVSYKKSINKAVILPVISLLFLYAVLLISYLFSPGEVYATEKIYKFTIATIPAIIFSLILFDNKLSVFRFFMLMVVLCTILSLYSFPSIIQRGSSLGFNEGNYQGLALLSGVSLIVITFYFLTQALTKTTKLISLLATIIIAFVLFSSGSRMPIIGFFIASIYLISNTVIFRGSVVKIRNGTRILLLLLIIAIGTLPVILKNGFLETIIYRFSVLFTEDYGGTSSAGRIERLSSAFEMISGSPFIGNGLGSFPLYFNGNDIYDYPHNIIIEIFAETGLLGLLAFTLFFLISLIRTISMKHSFNGFKPTLKIVIVGIFLYYFSNSLTSGDINGNRFLFVFMSMMCMFPVIFKNEDNDIDNIKLGM